MRHLYNTALLALALTATLGCLMLMFAAIMYCLPPWLILQHSAGVALGIWLLLLRWYPVVKEKEEG